MRELVGPTRLKWVLSEIDRRSSTGDGVLLAVSRHVGVVPREAITDRESRSESLEGYKVVKVGQFAVNKMRAFNGALGVAPSDGLMSPAYSVFNVSPGCDGRYLAYSLRNPFGLAKIAERIRGIGQVDQGNVRTPTLSARDLGEIVLDLPDLREQRRIADYLDRETSRIDALIDRRRRVIDLLEERFATHLTGVLFGDKYRHRVNLGRLCSCLAGFTFASEDFISQPDGAVRLLRGINVSTAGVRWDEVVYFPQSRIDERVSAYLLKEGDLVIGMDRPLIKSGVRVAALLASDVPALLVQRVARLRANELSTNAFIRLAMMSQSFQEHLIPITTGVSVPHVSEEQILSFKVPMMSKEEQSSVVRTLVGIREKQALVQAKLVKQLGLLQELRQGLITAAVTGRLNTRATV